MEWNKKILISHLSDLSASIDIVIKEKKQLPALIILYSTIDILAWLYHPVKYEEVRRSDFIKWCDQFLLPGEKLKCTSKDLYSARCGILHSYSAYSNMSRKGDAKQIWYSWGKADVQKFEQIINLSSYKNIAIAVQIESLITALKNGIIRFAEFVDKNPEIEKLVFSRAEKFFSNIPHE